MTKPGASTQARALAGTYNRGIGKPKIKPRPMWQQCWRDFETHQWHFGSVHEAKESAVVYRLINTQWAPVKYEPRRVLVCAPPKRRKRHAKR